MAIEKKERYIAQLEDGRAVNAVASTFQEVLQMYGEESIVYIKKLDYEEPKEE